MGIEVLQAWAVFVIVFTEELVAFVSIDRTADHDEYM